MSQCMRPGTPVLRTHRGDSVIGDIVRALQQFLRSRETEAEPLNRALYLRAASIQ